MARTLSDDPYAREPQLPAVVRAADVDDAIVIDHVAPGFERPRAERPERPRVKRRRPQINARGLRFTAAVLGTVVALIVLRASIVAALPQFSATLPADASALEFQRVHSETVKMNGTSAVVVEGEIVNRSDHDIALPAVRIALRAQDGVTVKSWRFEPAKDMLAAGQSIGFRSALAMPPTTATQVTLSLTGRDGSAAGLR